MHSAVQNTVLFKTESAAQNSVFLRWVDEAVCDMRMLSLLETDLLFCRPEGLKVSGWLVA